MIMNETIKTQLEHRSIRKFKQESLSKDIIETIINVANQTSSSVAMQTFSIIRITDKEKKKAIADICMQPYVVDVPELWIFVADVFRNASILAELDSYPENRNDMDKFFQAFSDSVLAAQNVMIAVESLGLGGVFFGSILNDPEEMIKILNLPEYTFPVLGIGFGYPDEKPDKKPRMSSELKFFENQYKIQESYIKALKDYDKILEEYYKNRETNFRYDSFTNHVYTKFPLTRENRTKIMNFIRKQGFELNLEYIPESEIRTMFKKAPKVVEEHVFEESKMGFKAESGVRELFDKYPFVKDYLLVINPRFNKLRTLAGTVELSQMNMQQLADMGDMPVDSLIYMIESRIDEE